MADPNNLAVVPQRSPNDNPHNAPSYVSAAVIADGTGSITVPPGAAFVRLAGTADFYARFDGTDAAVPNANVDDGTAAELFKLNGGAEWRTVLGVASIKLAAADGTVVTASFRTA